VLISLLQVLITNYKVRGKGNWEFEGRFISLQVLITKYGLRGKGNWEFEGRFISITSTNYEVRGKGNKIGIGVSAT